jgi:hypothetical protein
VHFLTVAGILGTVRWWNARRKRKAVEAEQAYIWRTPIRVGGNIVADELRANADIALTCEEGHSVSTEGMHIQLQGWKDRRGEIAPLEAEIPLLWTELVETYRLLGLTRSHGAFPPTSQSLFALADRLDKAAEG